MNEALLKKHHRPSNWAWKWYPGHGWYAPDGTYLVARPIFEPIRIVNPLGGAATLNYTLNGTPYAIPPGFSQELNDDRLWVIEFRRGPDLGLRRYALHSGRYRFASTTNGWELYRTEVPAVPPPVPTTPPPGQAGTSPAPGGDQAPQLPQPDAGATTPASTEPEAPTDPGSSTPAGTNNSGTNPAGTDPTQTTGNPGGK